MARQVGESFFDVDDGAHEMHGNGVVASCADDVVPELPTFFFGPGIRALIDGDDELGGFFEKIKESGFSSFHCLWSLPYGALLASLNMRRAFHASRLTPHAPSGWRRRQIVY